MGGDVGKQGPCPADATATVAPTNGERLENGNAGERRPQAMIVNSTNADWHASRFKDLDTPRHQVWR